MHIHANLSTFAQSPTDLTRVGGGGCIHRPKNESRWMPLPTQKTEWRPPPTLIFGSVEAFADPRNTIHPADCPMIVSLMSQDVMLRVKKYVCAL